MQIASDKYIPYYFIAFFLVIISIDGFLMYLSLSTWRGVVAEDSYQEGVNYNQIIEHSNNQEKLGWNSELNFTQNKPSQGVIDFIILDMNNNPINAKKAKLKMMNIFQEGHDFEQEILLDNGKSAINIDFPLKGKWLIRIHLEHEGNQYQTSKRILVY
jgi:nitrogen fixation protein FixH